MDTPTVSKYLFEDSVRHANLHFWPEDFAIEITLKGFESTDAAPYVKTESFLGVTEKVPLIFRVLLLFVTLVTVLTSRVPFGNRTLT